MYAVIETGGKQYRVQEGDVITIEKLDVTAGDDITFDKVLMFHDGQALTIGAPVVEAAKVFGSVVENGKGKKVIIFKYKAKKDYRKKQGHRQPYTMVQIEGLSADGKKPAAKKAAVKPAEEKVDVEATEKKPAAKKATAEKKTADPSAADKKPAAKKTAKAADAKDAE